MKKHPSFFKPRARNVAALRLPDYERVLREASQYRRKNVISPAVNDRRHRTVALFGIDIQVGFCNPKASLFVPGAVEDTIRSCQFIYSNLERISTIHFSLDTHRTYQIFLPTFWVNERHEHPEPFTIITSDDVASGKWLPIGDADSALEYVEKLEQEGRYSLCVWPYHTMIGSLDHALMPDIFEAAMFHSIVRTEPTRFEFKGQHPLTENYSVLSPEIKELSGRAVGQFNIRFFDTLMNHDRLYIMGQASSHCVKNTIEDLISQVFTVNPALIERVYVLEDCMSPVAPIKDEQGNISVDFPEIARQAFAGFASQGIRMVKSTELIEF